MVDDEPSKAQTSSFGQDGVTVGHGRPLFREMGFVVSPTLHSGVFPYVQPTRRVYLTSVVSTARLRTAIVHWVERTYHRKRRQRRLGKLTPVEYELVHHTAAVLAA